VSWMLVLCSIAWAQEAQPTVVDATRVFVFANPEVLAMGGAGSAFATGANGMVLSPAAPANRRMESVGPYQSSLILTHAGTTSDTANLGERSDDPGHIFNAGATGGYHEAAAGVLLSGTWYTIADTLTAVSEGHADAAYAFLDGRLTVGAGTRLLSALSAADGETSMYTGAGGEAGVVLANYQKSWNFALTLRSGVRANAPEDGIGTFDGARLPPEGAAGIGWSNIARLADGRGLPVRLAADVVVDAPVRDAVSLEGLLVGNTVVRGARWSISPRVGSELEVWRDRLRLRGGGYLEAARTDLAGSRPHATGGFEVRLFKIDALRHHVKLDLAWQAGVDYAPRYLRVALFGLNLWTSGAIGGVYSRPTE
jgi:hypothetical protein